METFANRLNTLRLAFCYTQKDIKEICKIPQSTLSAIEKGIFVTKKKGALICLVELFKCNKYWFNSGEYEPFSNVEGLVMLNKCREGINEAAALALLELAKPQKAVFYKKDSCLIFNIAKCYILLFLCEPYDINHILRKVNCTFLGTINTDLDLNSYLDVKSVIQEEDLLHDRVKDIIKTRVPDFAESLNNKGIENVLYVYKNSIVKLDSIINDLTKKLDN